MNTDLLTRPAEPEDLAEVAELYLATRRAAVPQMPPMVHPVDEVHAYVARLPETKEVWVAERDDIVGFLVLDGAWLDALYVGPAHQSTGVGSTLLDLAKGLRPEGFGLWVFASNTGARGFYHRHGLVELEHTDGSANEERAPDVRMAWPGTAPLTYLRGQIDEVDDQLALLLARRFALTATVQGFKERGGREGRDPAREAEIAERMARHVPGLGVGAVSRIMDVVIGESLDAHASGNSRS
ncbi:MAG: GNAT family N-acetyltransferase [Nocardioidaceae bacterium]|nr:GNAT family N-acetyltransferase [Nocardioidaceae bacterium]